MAEFKLKGKEVAEPQEEAVRLAKEQYQTLKTQKANPTTVPEIAKRLELIERILGITDTTGQAN